MRVWTLVVVRLYPTMRTKSNCSHPMPHHHFFAFPLFFSPSAGPTYSSINALCSSFVSPIRPRQSVLSAMSGGRRFGFRVSDEVEIKGFPSVLSESELGFAFASESVDEGEVSSRCLS